jgi:hypothetical protein
MDHRIFKLPLLGWIFRTRARFRLRRPRKTRG